VAAKDYRYGQKAMTGDKLAIVLVNLGTPAEATTSAVRKFLREFLSDRRVVDTPKFIWWLLLNLVILPLRSNKVANSYQKIWTPKGSPLKVFTSSLAAKLQDRVKSGSLDSGLSYEKAQVTVSWAMTYGDPSLVTIVGALIDEGTDKILVIPLYPQYSSTTTGSIYDRIHLAMKYRRNIPDIKCIHNYHANPGYISALADSVHEYWLERGRGEKLLISFHGVPERYIDDGDQYMEQCQRTAGLLAGNLALAENEWSYGFQSRFGRDEWIKPYSDKILTDWAGQGVKKVDVLCPGFATDCLETLEEIEITGASVFENYGGERLSYIPCLNDNQAHVDMLVNLITEYVGK
jgi:protoporphyrin/coproporphyrin ferrochelatase